MFLPSLHLEETFNASAADVRAALSDLRRFPHSQSQVVSVVENPPLLERRRGRRFRVHEKVLVGRFSIRNNYLAAVIPGENNEIHLNCWQWPRIRTQTVYRLFEAGGRTQLVEKCYIDAPRLLRKFVTQRTQTEHASLLASVKRSLERKRDDMC